MSGVAASFIIGGRPALEGASQTANNTVYNELLLPCSKFYSLLLKAYVSLEHHKRLLSNTMPTLVCKIVGQPTSASEQRPHHQHQQRQWQPSERQEHTQQQRHKSSWSNGVVVPFHHHQSALAATSPAAHYQKFAAPDSAVAGGAQINTFAIRDTVGRIAIIPLTVAVLDASGHVAAMDGERNQ